MRKSILKVSAAFVGIASFLCLIMLLIPATFMPTVDEAPNLPSITLNGHKFHAETYGDPTSPIILALHGGPGGDYRSLITLKALSDKYFIILYDQRMSGLSSRQSDIPITVQSFLDDLDAFVNHFDNGQPIYLVGHSWGAMMASGYIGQHPKKIAKAILIEPGILRADLAEEFMNSSAPKISFMDYLHLLPAWLNQWRIDTKTDSHAQEDYFMSMVALYFANKNRKDKAPFQGWRLGTYVQNQTINKISSDPELFASLDFLKGVEKFEGNVLFLSSSDNQVYGDAYQQQHLQYYQHATADVVPNSGHVIFIDQPDLSNTMIDNFLSGHETRNNKP